MTTLHLTKHARNQPYHRRVLLLLSALTSACALERDVSDEALRAALPSAAAIAAVSGGACVPGDDLTCNPSGGASWYAGRCLADATCACASGYVVDAANGKCVGIGQAGDGSGSGLAGAGGTEVGAFLSVAGSSSQNALRPVLQWVDQFGVSQGAQVALAPAGVVGAPTLATDGTRYVGCWTREKRVVCVSLTGRGTSATTVYEAPGAFPSLVFGAGSWVLATLTSDAPDAKTEVRRFDADFRPLGEAKTFDAATSTASSLGSGPLVAARPRGFVLVTGDPENVYPLDEQLALRGAPIPLQERRWGAASIAATETTIAVSLAVPYGARLFQIDVRGNIQETRLSGGGKTGLPLDLLAQGSSIHATWSDGTWHNAILGTTGLQASSNPESRLYPLVSVRVGANFLVGVEGQQGLRVRRVPGGAETLAATPTTPAM